MYRLCEKFNQTFYTRFYFIISSVNQKKNDTTRNKMQPKDMKALLRHLTVMSFIKKRKKIYSQYMFETEENPIVQICIIWKKQ